VGDNDTGDKFITRIKDTGEQKSVRDINTGEQFIAGVPGSLVSLIPVISCSPVSLTPAMRRS
jgi:hypothetical protein